VTKVTQAMPIKGVINFIWLCWMIFVDAQSISDVTAS
jgi:hypothetical protein